MKAKISAFALLMPTLALRIEYSYLPPYFNRSCSARTAETYLSSKHEINAVFVLVRRVAQFHLYDRRIERANSEISKGILGQTMTIDNGSSLSQSEVHLQVLQNLVSADADFLRDLINNRLLPFMAMHGFPVAGYRFDWDEAVEYKPEEMRAIEQMLLTAGYEINPQYFIDKYNIDITGRREVFPAAQMQAGVDFFA
jgi:hypothetical protein